MSGFSFTYFQFCDKKQNHCDFYADDVVIYSFAKLWMYYRKAVFVFMFVIWVWALWLYGSGHSLWVFAYYFYNIVLTFVRNCKISRTKHILCVHVNVQSLWYFIIIHVSTLSVFQLFMYLDYRKLFMWLWQEFPRFPSADHPKSFVNKYGLEIYLDVCPHCEEQPAGRFQI